jgi:uncharacterized iron-regulated membrane protein
MDSPAPSHRWPDYRAVWRWHFYAGLFCIPFVVVLAASGAIYLFKAEIEALEEARYDSLPPGAAMPPSAQVAAALAAVPGSRFEGYELPAAPGRAARVLLGDAGTTRRTYVDPATAEVLGSVRDRDRPMKILFRLHGELLMGDRGSNLVELAASWTIVMVITGLVLWWPRRQRGLAGVLWPRWRGGRRLLMRDLHAVTAAWLSVFTLLLLMSGLPWAKSWGDWLTTARAWTGTAAVRQEWSNRKGPDGGGEAPAAEGGHGDHGRSARGRGADPVAVDPAALDRVAALVAPLGLDPPVVLAPARGGAAEWSAKSLTANRPRRVSLVVDADRQAVLSREDFASKHPVDRAVAVGIAFHEGRLFGLPNQLLGLVTALGLILVCASAVWLWLRRRDPGTLGAPEPGLPPRRRAALVATVAALGIALPLFGLSLLTVALAERLVLRRIPPVAAWLGLTPPAG